MSWWPGGLNVLMNEGVGLKLSPDEEAYSPVANCNTTANDDDNSLTNKLKMAPSLKLSIANKADVGTRQFDTGNVKSEKKTVSPSVSLGAWGSIVKCSLGLKLNSQYSKQALRQDGSVHSQLHEDLPVRVSSTVNVPLPVQLRTQVTVTVAARWRLASTMGRVFAQCRTVLPTIGARTRCHYSDMIADDGYRIKSCVTTTRLRNLRINKIAVEIDIHCLFSLSMKEVLESHLLRHLALSEVIIPRLLNAEAWRRVLHAMRPLVSSGHLSAVDVILMTSSDDEWRPSNEPSADQPGCRDIDLHAVLRMRLSCSSILKHSDSCVRRIAFCARLKEPLDHHRWSPVGLVPDSERRERSGSKSRSMNGVVLRTV
uniref:SFRICE_024973 n=1 Tax=Spodoptera frugiperda TaxID=7108 RepID=A0A2H1V770_SPOFR